LVAIVGIRKNSAQVNELGRVVLQDLSTCGRNAFSTPLARRTRRGS
jgi:hypothetical protein